MTDVIFLNESQLKSLKEAGMGLTMLTHEILKKVLTASDYWALLDVSKKMRTPGYLLHELGFENISKSNVELTERTSIKEEIKNRYYLNNNRVAINAACHNKELIIVWEEAVISNNANCMFKVSLLNIMRALYSVLTFEEIKHTKQFEICAKLVQ